MNLIIGSGDISKLLSGKKTKGYAGLLQKFVSNDKPYYNAYASPIDALRTGAILEDKYLDYLDDDYYIQYKSTSEDYNCLTSSIDFAKIDNGRIVDFEELKTIWFTEYIDVIKKIENAENSIDLLKVKFKNNYNQVQFQLLCSGLESATLTFLCVYSYDDEENKKRVIECKDVTKFRIERDEVVIDKIKQRAVIFQAIKDNVQ